MLAALAQLIERAATANRGDGRMSEGRVEPAQLRRRAFIHMQQSSPTQVERNRESTQRQYALVDRAHGLGRRIP